MPRRPAFLLPPPNSAAKNSGALASAADAAFASVAGKARPSNYADADPNTPLPSPGEPVYVDHPAFDKHAGWKKELEFPSFLLAVIVWQTSSDGEQPTEGQARKIAEMKAWLRGDAPIPEDWLADMKKGYQDYDAMTGKPLFTGHADRVARQEARAAREVTGLAGKAEAS